MSMSICRCLWRPEPLGLELEEKVVSCLIWVLGTDLEFSSLENSMYS